MTEHNPRLGKLTPEDAAVRLAEIQAEIDRTGKTSASLRERLDLYYLATGTTAEDYEDTDDGW